MIARRVLDDQIVSATSFRARQGYWLGIASKRPVTIHTGENNIVVFNRDRIRELYLTTHYLESAVRLYDEIEKLEKSTIYPWLEYLNAEEIKQFQKEFIANILVSITADNWDNTEELLSDWEATARTKGNAKVMKALKAKVNKDDYVIIK